MLKRISLSESPFPLPVRPRQPQYLPCQNWPAVWVHLADAQPPAIIAYRLRFNLAPGQAFRFHLAADEQYDLWWNGKRAGRGSERCSPMRWAFDSYEGVASNGQDTLVVRVWSLGQPHRPAAQQSVSHGLLVADDSTNETVAFNTGTAEWTAKALAVPVFLPKGPCFGTSAFERQNGTCGETSWKQGNGDGWEPVQCGEQGISAGRDWVKNGGRRLAPNQLPAMHTATWQQGQVRAVAETFRGTEKTNAWLESDNLVPLQKAWQRLWKQDTSLLIPPNTRQKVLIDLEDYVCAFPSLEVSGGAGSVVKVHWEETLYMRPGRLAFEKGNRDQWNGKYFEGFGDTFLPDGPRRSFAPLWWRCGRYVQLWIETKEASLEITSFSLEETHYPYARTDQFSMDDERFLRVLPVLERGLQMCAHDFLMDCPFYEQLMYAGDAFIQSRAILATSHEKKLPRKVLSDFFGTRSADGIPTATFTANGRLIPPFSLSWITGLRDYLLYRDDPAALRDWLPAARNILEWWLRDWKQDGLVPSPEGWNFVDWVAWNEKAEDWNRIDWHTGAPPGGLGGENSVLLNWWLVKTLLEAAELETWANEPLMAQRWRAKARQLAKLTHHAGWDDVKKLYRDSPGFESLSQHTQVMALLAGMVPPEVESCLIHALQENKELAEASLFFGDFLLEAAYRVKASALFFSRLEEWRAMPEHGFKTPYETHPEKSRSDCHGWASHPLYHIHASVLGVRPTAPAFQSVAVAPHLLTSGNGVVEGRTPHPSGQIRTRFKRQGDRWEADVSLPADIDGTFVFPSGHQVSFNRRFSYRGHDPGIGKSGQ